MGEAEDLFTASVRESVERGGLHLDGENSLVATTGDGRGRLAKGCVGRPGAAALDRQAVGGERSRRRVDEVRIGLGVSGRRQVVIARPLVADGPIDEDEVGRRSDGSDLTRRRDTQQDLAARGEQLLGDEDGERRTDDTADQPE